MSEIINKLIRLDDGECHKSNGEEYVITEDHSLNDVLRFVVEQLGVETEECRQEVIYLINNMDL